MNFIYDPYQENISILGMQGSGKTTKAKHILATIPRVMRWIWSPQKAVEHYGAFGAPVSDFKDLIPGAYVWNGSYSKSAFDSFCSKAMTYQNLLIVVDDVHEYVSKQKIPGPFGTLINSGRNKGICGIYLSPSPNLVNNVVLQSSQHIFAFRFNLEAQIEWMQRNYFGDDAWLLLPHHLRRKKPVIADVEMIPKYAHLYRKHTDMENSYVSGDAPA